VKINRKGAGSPDVIYCRILLAWAKLSGEAPGRGEFEVPAMRQFQEYVGFDGVSSCFIPQWMMQVEIAS